MQKQQQQQQQPPPVVPPQQQQQNQPPSPPVLPVQGRNQIYGGGKIRTSFTGYQQRHHLHHQQGIDAPYGYQQQPSQQSFSQF